MSTSYPNFSDLGGSLKIVLRHADESDKKWSAFNPSIAQDPDGATYMLVRSGNYWFAEDWSVKLNFDQIIRNRTWFYKVDPDTLEVSEGKEVIFPAYEGVRIHRGPEDGRLFWREDGWHFVSVLYEPPEIRSTRLALFRLDTDTGVADLVEVHEGVKPNRAEKNWMPPSRYTNMFEYVYSPTQRIIAGLCVGEETSMNGSVRRDMFLSNLRGGTQLVLQEDGGYLAVVHDVALTKADFSSVKTFEDATKVRSYRHYFARYDSTGIMTHVSEPFVFKRITIEFAAGMIEHEDDLLISFGALDVSSGIARISKKKALSLLKPVQS